MSHHCRIGRVMLKASYADRRFPGHTPQLVEHDSFGGVWVWMFAGWWGSRPVYEFHSIR